MYFRLHIISKHIKYLINYIFHQKVINWIQNKVFIPFGFLLAFGAAVFGLAGSEALDARSGGAFAAAYALAGALGSAAAFSGAFFYWDSVFSAV